MNLTGSLGVTVLDFGNDGVAEDKTTTRNQRSFKDRICPKIGGHSVRKPKSRGRALRIYRIWQIFHKKYNFGHIFIAYTRNFLVEHVN